MKHLILILLTAAAIASCSDKDGKAKQNNPLSDFSEAVNPAEASKNFIKKEHKLSFDAIEVSSAIEAEVIRSNEEKVIISAPDNIMKDILVENTGGKLHIHFRPYFKVRGFNHVKVTVFAKDLDELKANSSGSIKVSDKFTQEKMNVEVTSSGSVDADLEANDFSLHVSSSGDFEGEIWAVNLDADVSGSALADLKGKAKNAVIQVSSSGTVDAEDLNVETADLQASGSGDVNISVSRAVTAAASSSGDINIKKIGNPTVSKTQNSSGSVTVR